MSPSPADLALNAASAWGGPARCRTLVERFGGAEGVLRAGALALGSCGAGLTAPQVRAFLDYCAAFDGDAEARALKRPGVGALRRGAPPYPEGLAALPDAPHCLYVEGSLPGAGVPAVAVVGSRRPTDYGRRMARRVAGELARAGVWVVSGLARGIDAEAHAACLEQGGRGLAVLGSGLDQVWPPENAALARRLLAAGGGIVSQFPMAAPPMKHHFPLRNGVISGLSLGVVVVEGARGSGSLITADRALEQGREVFAVPGPADEPMSQGPLDLIVQGARLVRDGREVLKELGLKPGPKTSRSAAPAPQPGTPAARLLGCLREGRPVDLDAAARMSGLDAADLAAAVTELELSGAVRRLSGARVERP